MEDKQEKAEKELFALYKKTKDPEIKKEITMQYLYIARTTATKLYDLYSTTMQMEDALPVHQLLVFFLIHASCPRMQIL